MAKFFVALTTVSSFSSSVSGGNGNSVMYSILLINSSGPLKSLPGTQNSPANSIVGVIPNPRILVIRFHSSLWSSISRDSNSTLFFFNSSLILSQYLQFFWLYTFTFIIYFFLYINFNIMKLKYQYVLCFFLTIVWCSKP